jgi:hypothetical protein
MALSCWVVLMFWGVLVFLSVSDCWTAKQPPKGPARALLRHRTVQMFPVDADACQYVVIRDDVGIAYLRSS